jgi:hypothetical protein
MKELKLVLVGAFLAAAAGPLLAAPHLCPGGRPPALSGDLFSPVECSTSTKAAVMLPGVAVVTKDAKTDLRDLEGRWEGFLTHALGRYELLLGIQTRWTGKSDLTLEIKEMQFHERLTDRLSLASTKGRGAYDAVLTTTLAPDASLKGAAVVGAAAAPEVSTGTAKVPTDRQADLRLSNGAAYRVYFSLKGKDELRVRAFSGIPGAPLQTFELSMTRTKKEAL